MAYVTINKARLSAQQVEALFECHERELLNMLPCPVIQPHVKGLLIRGLAYATYGIDENGKDVMVAHITENGKQYLETYVKKYCK